MAEEKVKILFKGELIEAIRREDASYYVNLPAPISLKRTITTTNEGWKYDEYDVEHPESFFWMKMNNDGTVEYTNEMLPDVKLAAKDYHPDFSDLGTFNGLGKDMYGVIQQLEGYEKLGVSPIDVLNLRRDIMNLTLKMLGYKDTNSVFYTEPNADESIMDLHHVVEYLEKYPALAQYVSRMKYMGLDTVIVNTPGDFSKEKFKEVYENAKADYDSESEYVTERLSEIERRRYELLLPDFCKGLKPFLQKNNLRKRSDPNAWDKYSDTVKRMAKMVLGFNADLLSAHEKMKVVQSISLDQFELLDVVATITEPSDMDEVLADESYFFMNEAKRFSERINETLGDERTENSSTGKITRELEEETIREAKERIEAIQNRHYQRNVRPFDQSRKEEARKKIKRLNKEDDDRGYFD